MLRARAAVLWSVMAFAGAAGCGGASGTNSPVIVSNHVSIVIMNGVGATDLPFDPREARIESATHQLTEIAGHPLTFQFDVALLPDWRVGFEEALIDTLENVARDLSQLKEDEPEAFAYGAPKVERVVCKYSALVGGDGDYEDERSTIRSAVLDESEHAVILTSRAEGSLVPRASVAVAITRAYEAAIVARYGTKDPADVPTNERAAYFKFIASYGRSGDPAARDYAKSAAGKAEPTSPSAASQIPNVTKLAGLVGTSDPKLAADIRKWLFGQMDDFSGAYINDSAKIRALPPDSRWRRAETAWIAWLNGVLPTLSDDEARIVTVSGFVIAYSDSATRYHHEAFPGFDPFAFGLCEADAWIAAGHPTKRGEGKLPEARAQTFATVVCLQDLGRVDRCSWLTYAADGDDTTKKLADALITRRDAALTEAAFRGFPRAKRIVLLRDLERDETTLEVALHALTKDEPDASLVPELRHEWRAHPAQRGLLLYVIASEDRYGDPESSPNGTIGWTTFAQSFDGGASRRDIASFFGQGIDAVPLSRWIFDARADRASFVDLLIPKLDAWIDRPKDRDERYGHENLVSVIKQICADHDENGISQLRDYFARRAKTHPGDSLNTEMDGWQKGQCKK